MEITITRIDRNPNFPEAFIGEPKIGDCFRHFLYSAVLNKSREQGVLKVTSPLIVDSNNYTYVKVEYYIVVKKELRNRDFYLVDFGTMPYGRDLHWNLSNYLIPISLEEYTKTISKETVSYKTSDIIDAKWTKLDGLKDFEIKATPYGGWVAASDNGWIDLRNFKNFHVDLEISDYQIKNITG